jgi:transcriptional regulator with XRE-family HTH domain
VSSKQQSEFKALWAVISSRLGWSQSELARRIGVTPSAISLLVSSSFNPRTQTIQSIRTLLQLEAPQVLVEADELLRRQAGGGPGSGTLLPTFPTELERYQKGLEHPHERVVELRENGPDYGAKIRQLPPEQRRALRDLIDALVSSDLGARALELQAGAIADIRHGAEPRPPHAPGVRPGADSPGGSGHEGGGGGAAADLSGSVGKSSVNYLVKPKPGKTRRK